MALEWFIYQKLLIYRVPGLNLLVIILISIVDHVEESQLVDTRRCRDHAKPVPQLLLLEEFLRPESLKVSHYFGKVFE